MNEDEFTISEFFIEVGNGHSLYVQDWGNKRAKSTIIFLHGGPGSGSKDKHKNLFYPDKQRVIFFDQRGSGRSLPAGSLKHNTTKDLVEDIEKIAKHLKLDKFVLHGNSWGSALSLFYAIKYPKRVKAMVICGVFTGSHAEINWLDGGQFRATYPDAWDFYLSRTPKAHHDNPTAYHVKRAFGTDEKAVRESAYAYNCLEGSIASFNDVFVPANIDEFDPSGTLIEMHYMKNHCFVPDRYVFNNINKLTMPIYLVEGRYDMICPPTTAYELGKVLPKSELIWALSGHSYEHENWNINRTILLRLSQEK
jgi:proline iminopeptidase